MHQRRQYTPCQSDCSLGLGPDRSVCRECNASQAVPTDGAQVAEQQKDAANLLTKHRTTPVSPRKSPYGKRSKQADKETPAVTQLEANQAQVTNIGEACTTTGRAPAVLSHPNLACRAAETTARGASTTHQTCRGVSIRVVPKSRRQQQCRVRCDQDVQRRCQVQCAKPDPAMREGQPDAVLMQLCEPSTRQSLNMWLEGQCSSV